ncbi:MAG: hypothetical protein IKN24_08090 [Lachnospiraceae bacterium]|nr:hypothetical protein [Lachnospiraceae bacterium]
MNRTVKRAMLLSICALITGCADSGNEKAKETTAMPQTTTDASSGETPASVSTEAATETEDVPETEKATETQEQTQEPKVAAADVSALFTGNFDDFVHLDDYGYIEGDRYLIYLEKDVNVPGDLITRIEEIMALDEKVLGLSFDVSDYAEFSDWRHAYYGDVFDGLPEDKDRIHIMISKETGDGYIEWSVSDEIMLFDQDFDPQYSSGEVIYHELAHVLRLRQSPMLGQVLEEGIAIYAEYNVSMERNTPCWSCIQFVTDEYSIPNFDDSLIREDPEEAFREYNVADRSSGQPEYQLGIRLVSFLVDEYGEDIFAKLSQTAAKYDFEEKDNDKVIAILKEATSDDVFDRFKVWMDEGWKVVNDRIVEYLRGYGF